METHQQINAALFCALALSSCGRASAAEPAVVPGIQSTQAFAALLEALSNSAVEAQPQLMYRVADLPGSVLKGTVAHIPLGFYEVDAKPQLHRFAEHSLHRCV
ncbi:hypothetical protein PQS31_08400 [Luteimonas sp BLCC-B24]|uniref:hypothetical protein n=1 Tax=Luteimonas sp. BLCC-B24 TaxID=3025317 RepID=UPI00234CA39F|nr:hypothetical protein [Luteimonas sp. BLCC-B24]MDC7806837.1 hypothetical protein [Luteimonas sp. BLCC-B24]